MVKFKCCQKMDIDYDDGESEWKEIEASDPKQAAEKYADIIFHGEDMWEVKGVWELDYAVVVEDGDGKRTTFNIIVEQAPVFYATPALEAKPSEAEGASPKPK